MDCSRTARKSFEQQCRVGCFGAQRQDPDAAAGKSLIGNGTVRGSVVAASGSLVAPGFSIGTLVVTNGLTFQSGSSNLMEISAATHTNDLLVGIASVSYGGKLIVTNIGGVLAAGDSFKLFSAGSYNNAFASITLPALAGNLMWTNRLGVDGSLAVISPVNTAPTNLAFMVAGGQLQLSWPADHTGWRLEVQTNALGTGLGINWSTVPGSAQPTSCGCRFPRRLARCSIGWFIREMGESDDDEIHHMIGYVESHRMGMSSAKWFF